MVTNRARQEIVWIAPNEKIPKVAQTPGTVDVFDLRSGISGPTSRGSFRLSKSSWMMDPTRSREMPSCSAVALAEIRPAVFQH